MNYRRIVVFGLVLLLSLYFQYVLIILLQSSAAESEDISEFAITTGRGVLKFAGDINWFSNDIKSVYYNPGLFLRDSTTYEYQNEIIPLQGTPPFLMHAAIYAITKNPTATLIFGSVISSIIIIILLVVVGKFMLKRCWMFKFNELLIFLLLTLFFTFPHAVFDFLQILSGVRFMYPYTGYVGRFININHIVIFLLIWFGLIYLYLNSDMIKNSSAYARSKKFIPIGVGVSLAILQYSYIYFATGALVYTGIVLLLHHKLRFGKKLIVDSFLIYGTWLLLASPYVYNYISYPVINAEFIAKAGAISSSIEPTWSYLSILFVICIIFCLISQIYWKDKRQLKSIFQASALEVSLFITMLLMLNLHLIIGYTVQPFHWIWAFMIPIIILIGFEKTIQLLLIIHKYDSSCTFIKRNNIRSSPFNKQKTYTAYRATSLALITVITILLMVNITKFVLASVYWYQDYYFDSKDKEFFDFIKSRTKSDEVFFADSSHVNDLILTNTDRRVLLGHSLHTRMNKDEINSRLMYGYTNLNKTKDDLYADLTSCGKFASYTSMIKSNGSSYEDANFNYLCFYYHSYYDEGYLYGYNTDQIKKDLEKINLKSATYKLDYLVFSKNKSNISSESIVFENDRYLVVRK